MRIVFRNTIVFLAITVLVIGQYSCSRKSDSWTSRTYHKMVSKFNPYFNGEEAYEAGVISLEKSHKDDYDEILKVYRWGTADQATAVAPQMDRALEKSAKVIKDHSMVVKGQQKNTYVIKSYLLIGKARFYKHDFFPSLETFNYVIQQFSKDKKAADFVAEAQLWAGRCQLMIDNPTAAANYFNELYNNRRISNRFKADISASMAQMHINSKDYESAVISLTEAISRGPQKQQKIRWTFIRAQLHERLNNNYESSQDYKAVIAMKPNNYDMLFTAQLNRAKNFDVYLENASIVYKELEKMLADEKNTEYRDQIYYVMAGVAINEEEWGLADEYLKQSVRASVSNNNQKGLSYLKIADINFDFKEYVLAQAYYDSASTTLPTSHKLFAFANKRKETLTGLVKNINIIEVEDSLQIVAKMSPEKQRQLYLDYIEWLKEDEARKQREKELRELNEQLIAESKNMNGGPSVGPQGGWYFYNQNIRTSGISRFKQKWGNRTLEDSWRRKNKNVAFTNTQEEGDSTVNANNPKAQTGGKYDVEYYLVQVPNTTEMLDTSNKRIERAYVALGDIYREDLADYDESSKSYHNLLNRFPNSGYEPRVLYSLYRLYINQNKEESAEPFKTELVQKYPASVYTKMILNPKSLSKNDEGYKKAEALYEEFYQEFKKGNYKSLINKIDKNTEVYENGILEPKFILLKTMCYGKLKKNEEFIAGLKLIVESYPNTREAVLAQTTLDLTDDGEEEQIINAESKFTYEGGAPHKFLAIVPNNGVDINSLRNAFADFNTQYFKLERLQLQNIFLDQDRQLVIVSGLKNSAKAKVYYNSILANQTIMGYLPPKTTVKLIISDQNYIELYKSKNIEEYLKFLKDKYQIEESI